MAAIAFNAAQRASQRLETVLTAVGEKFDVFVSHQIRQKAAEAGSIHTLTDDEPSVTATPFQPLDTTILSEAIPAFFIGRNEDGFWVTRDARGRAGGLFLRKASAVSFARAQSGDAGCATIFPIERFELDLENSGNPIIPHLGPLLRLARRLRRRSIVAVRQIMSATGRRRKA